MDLQWHLLVAAAVVGYLCGSVSFARIIGRIFAPGEDFSRVEIGGEGQQRTLEFDLVTATTVATKLGPKAGLLTSLLDLFKVLLPALAFRLLFPGAPYFLAAAAFGVVGHNWPLYYAFRGGAGLSAALGGLLAVDWLGVLVLPLAGMILGLAVFRDMFAAAALWVVLMLPWLWLRTHDLWHLSYAAIVFVSFFLASVPTLKRYVRLRREDPAAYLAIVQSSHMGRGMLRIGRLFGMGRKPGGR
jgi:glycerol-3-phosphate acyltransferase PlsY